jgi:hypothetical protein
LELSTFLPTPVCARKCNAVLPGPTRKCFGTRADISVSGISKQSNASVNNPEFIASCKSGNACISGPDMSSLAEASSFCPPEAACHSLAVASSSFSSSQGGVRGAALLGSSTGEPDKLSMRCQKPALCC